MVFFDQKYPAFKSIVFSCKSSFTELINMLSTTGILNLIRFMYKDFGMLLSAKSLLYFRKGWRRVTISL
jgi:hypothetical protein